MEEDNTREVFLCCFFFFLLNKVSSNKGGDSNKGNPEQIQLGRQASISIFYNALWEHCQVRK